MKNTLKFKRLKNFCYWTGIYNRLIGGSYWKVSDNRVRLEWNIDSFTKAILDLEESSAMYELAEAVNDAKYQLGGGGRWIIYN